MRCNRARRLWARKFSRGISQRQDGLLARHLKVCEACSRIEQELDMTWNALGAFAGIEPSADFLPRLRTKLRAEDGSSAPERKWHYHLRWQWAALAVCALLAIVLLKQDRQFRHEASPGSQVLKTAADSDRADEQLLLDLDHVLQSADNDYLSAYDSWPGLTHQPSGREPARENPSAKSKRKESS